ncbi:glycosyltransferase family 2 protein [Leptotrichia sp. oral taxon 218]|uniref:glycosyltransferase family 2 protein n=1 Tax=Leptotrichia sp. oral taxon 218 TaxID=712361 RepID=UPI001B8BAF9A|nr:glycosyltransferase family 2 protein [Leptotrichia sp. oral taxon 218]QUB95284.1 glycosyltransferase family 2 protein [Leptotrichia sp. oral taxon 218]
MATYNGEKYLSEQIDSIINQTYQGWNLLIRDDGSTDSTMEIIESYQKKDTRIKILKDNKGNLGIVKNFEELLKISKAKLIMFSDQDDIWKKEKILRYLERLEKIKEFKNEKIMIHSNSNLYREKNQKLNLFISDKFLEQKLENVFFNFFVQGATIMITKSLKEFILPFPEEVYIHDRYIHLLTDILFKRVFINESFMDYRQHENNQIGGNTDWKKLISKRYFYEKDYKLIKKIYELYKNRLNLEQKNMIESYFKITNVKQNRLRRYTELKKSNINMPLKKQLSLLLKG